MANYDGFFCIDKNGHVYVYIIFLLS